MKVPAKRVAQFLDRRSLGQHLLLVLLAPILIAAIAAVFVVLAIDYAATLIPGPVVAFGGTIYQRHDGRLAMHTEWDEEPTDAHPIAQFHVLTQGRVSGNLLTGPISEYFDATTKEYRLIQSDGSVLVVNDLPADSPLFKVIDQHVRATASKRELAAWEGRLRGVERTWWWNVYGAMTLVFTFLLSMIAMLLLGIGEARRAHRLTRGRCPRCNYDVRGDFESGCPECGWRRPAPGPRTRNRCRG